MLHQYDHAIVGSSPTDYEHTKVGQSRPQPPPHSPIIKTLERVVLGHERKTESNAQTTGRARTGPSLRLAHLSAVFAKRVKIQDGR